MSKKEKKSSILKAIGATAAVAGGTYAGFSYAIFRGAFDLLHSKLYKTDGTLLPEADEEMTAWYAHSEKQDEFIDSFDGIKLHATIIRNHEDCHHWLVFVPHSNTFGTGDLTHLYEADHSGFNILAIDNRGTGMSSGQYTGLGWLEHYDLISWINRLISIDPDAEIALYGLVIGATAVMNAVGDYLPKNVKCAVEDGGISDFKEILIHTVKERAKVDAKPFLPGVNFLVKQKLHFSLNDVNTMEQLKKTSIPMLFMHGNHDNIIPTRMVFDNYYNCASEKELFIAQEAGHLEETVDPQYYQTIFRFIRKYIPE